MKKASLIALLLAAPLFFLADWTVSSILHTLLDKSGFRFVTLYHKPIEAELLILGDSRAKALVNVEQSRSMGVLAFNLAANGMGYRVSEALLKDYLDRNDPPAFVILNIMSTKVETDFGAINTIKSFYEYSERFRILWEAHNPSAAKWGRWVRTFRYNGKTFIRALSFWKRSDQGHTMDHTIPPALCKQGNREDKMLDHGLTPERVKTLRALSTELKAKGSSLLLIASPIYLVDQSRLVKMRATIKDIRRLLPNIPLLDYSTTFKKCKYFGDTVHLNTVGTTALTERVIAALMEKELKTLGASREVNL